MKRVTIDAAAITRLRSVFLAAAFVIVSVSAQELSNIPASFVDVGFGARPAALGGAYTALSNDVHSTLWNPAGMAQMRRPQASFSYTDQLGLFVYKSFSAVVPLNANAVGVAVISSGDAALQEMTVQASYARSVAGALRAGVTLKYRFASFGKNTIGASESILFDPDEIAEAMGQQVQGTSQGFGVDVGMQYTVSPTVSVGMMLRDLYAPMRWNSSVKSSSVDSKGSYNEPLPAQMLIGTAVRMPGDIIVTADLLPALRGGMRNALRSGAEVRLLKLLSLRGGVQQPLANDADLKYTMGMGIDYALDPAFRILVDYTYMNETLANSQRLSIGMEF